MANELVTIPIEVVTTIEGLLAIQKIASPEQAQSVSDGINLIGKQLNMIEGERVRRKAPVLELGRQIDSDAAKIAAPLKKADVQLRGLQKAYLVEQQRIADEENARVERENAERRRIAKEEEDRKIAEAEEEARFLADLDGGDADKAAEEARQAAIAPTLFNPPAVELEIPVAVQKSVVGNYGSTGLRDNWTFEVVDASKVPVEYLVVNEAAIKAVIKAGVRKLPGVRIYNDQIVTRRS